MTEHKSKDKIWSLVHMEIRFMVKVKEVKGGSNLVQRGGKLYLGGGIIKDI